MTDPVDAALNAWFRDALERTPETLRAAVIASHRDRMTAALEAARTHPTPKENHDD